MKRLIWLLLTTFLFPHTVAQDTHRWVLIYNGPLPGASPFGGCITDGAAWTQCTHEGEVTEYFVTEDLALQRLNETTTFSCTITSITTLATSNSACESSSPTIPPDKFIGFYKLVPVPLEQVQVGTAMKAVEHTDYVPVPKMEWQVKK